MSLARSIKRKKREKGKKMEIKITAAQCLELYASGVGSAKFKDGSATLGVAQILYAVRPITEAYEQSRKALLEEYAITREDGELEVGEDGMARFKDSKARRAFEAAQREILNASTTVTVPDLRQALLASDGLTPAALMTLLPFTQGE